MWSRRLAAAVIAGVALAASAAPGKSAPAAPSDQELRQLRDRIDRLQKDLARTEESRGEAADALKVAEKAVSDANRALHDLATARGALEGELAQLARRSEAARAAIDGQRLLAERLLRLQYQTGGADRLRLLLEGRDLADVSRQLAYYGYIQRARAEVLASLKAGAEEIEELEAAARERRAALTENQAAQEREAKRLARERTERATLHQRLAGEANRSRREIGRLKRDEQRLTRLVEEIARELAARDARKAKPRPPEKAAPPQKTVPPQRSGPAPGRVAPPEPSPDRGPAGGSFAALQGRLALPVRGELAHRYGSPREEGGATWRGLFIRAVGGETVRAVADGQVVYADWLRGFGNLLILDHGGGYMSLYGHNEGLLRRVGDSVRSGDPVAQVGATGGGEETGLYFELRHEGRPFDPLRWMAR